jgi:hypothetical protein
MKLGTGVIGEFFVLAGDWRISSSFPCSLRPTLPVAFLQGEGVH